MRILRKRIEPDPPVVSTPAPPSATIPDQTPMEEDSVNLASPSGVPPPPVPEAQNEGERPEQQQEERQEERQEEEQQQPPPPTGSDDLLTPSESQSDSKTG